MIIWDINETVIELLGKQKMVDAKMEALIDILSKEGIIARIDFEERVESRVNKKI